MKNNIQGFVYIIFSIGLVILFLASILLMEPFPSLPTHSVKVVPCYDSHNSVILGSTCIEDKYEYPRMTLFFNLIVCGTVLVLFSLLFLYLSL